MIKCLECGKEVVRLQWTHFKYKCTGKFSNGKEYMKAYTDAKVVDTSLSKRTAITKDNMITKYGEFEGIRRWNSYRKKQAISNTFEYKKEKHGWDNQDFESYNKLRATTLLNMIDKYGKEAGLVKWNTYCERQRYTNSIDYFIETHGSIAGTELWHKINTEKAKSTNILHISEKYQVSFEEAGMLLSKRMSRNYVSEGEKAFVDQLEMIIEDISYTYKNKQFCIWNSYTYSPMFYDIVSIPKKKIIEYNGDYWHMNPLIYNETFVMKQTGKTATEIRERDRLKKLCAEEQGFSLFVVWESKYQSNPETVLKDVKKWWNDDK